MPWSKVDGSEVDGCDDDQIAVVKDEDRSLEGCHDTEEEADEQLAALNASEDEGRDAPEALTRAEEKVGDVVEREYTGVVERAEEGADDPIVMRFNRGSTTDAHGTRFDMTGADLERFRKNPIVRFAHGKDTTVGRMPIARADVSVQGEDLVAQLRFDQEDETARKVESKIRRGFLNAGSIAAAPTAAPEMRSVGNEEVVAFPEWELRGLSVVDIPSNPDALALSRDADEERMHGGHDSHFRQAVRGLWHAEAARRSMSEDLTMAQAKEAVKADVDSQLPGGFFSVDGPSCPFSDDPSPMDRFEALAGVLSVDVGVLITAAEADGCMYDMEQRAIDRETRDVLTRQEAADAITKTIARRAQQRRQRMEEQEQKLRQTTKQVLGKA